MKKLVLSLALVSGVAVAHPVHPVWHGKRPNFNEVKSRIVNMLDKRIKFLQGREACVEKAQNWKGLRDCRPKPMRRPMRRFGR